MASQYWLEWQTGSDVVADSRNCVFRTRHEVSSYMSSVLIIHFL